jgi:hypothetical protein
MTKNNEYSSIASQLFEQQPEQEIKLNVNRAVETNPDEYAQSYKLAQQENLPVETVQTNFPEVEKRSKVKKFNNEYTAFLKENPKVAEFIRVPENARLSFDEIDKLGTLEKTFKVFGKAYEQGIASNQVNRTKFFQNSGAVDFDISQKQIDNLRNILGDSPDKEGFINKFVYPAAKIIGQFTEMGTKAIAAGAGTASLAAIAGQAGPQVATPEEIVTVPAAFIAGSTAFLAADSYMINAGQTLLSLEDIEKESGEQFDPLVKQGAAAFVGLANAALEMVGVKYTVAPFRGAINKYLKDEGKELLVNKTKSAAVKKFATQYAKAVGAETATELMQEGVSIFAEQVAQEISREDFKNVLQDPEEFQKMKTRLYETGSEVFRGMALLGVVGPGANFSVDYAKAKKAKRNQEMMEALGADAKESKLLERVPEKYKEFVQKAKGSVENVYMNVDEFQTYFQSKQIDPEQIAEELGISNQLEEARDSGGDLVIPLENYAEKLAATEFHDELVPNLKFAPDDFTATEADKINADIQTMLQEQYQEAENTQFEDRRKQAPVEKVYDEVVGQLQEAGRSLDVAQKEATLWRSFFETMGERSGVDPYSLYKKQNIKITRELPSVLKKKDVNEMDLMIEKFRSFKGVSDKKLFGDSLLDFVSSQGGVNASDVNAGGLEAIGVEQYHQDRKFRKRILQEQGRSLDDLALAAWEAGYFPESSGRPDINDLLDKIDTELRGQPQYSQLQGDTDLEAEVQQIDDLDRFFNEIGVDTNEMSNAEIKERILEFEQSGGQEFFQDRREDFQERVIAAQDFRDEVKEAGRKKNVNPDGSVTLYHGTAVENVESINQEGLRDGSFLSLTREETTEHTKQNKENEVLEVRVDARDVEFSSGTQEVFAPNGLVRDEDGVWKSPARVEESKTFFQSQQEEKDLVAQHNLSAANLENVDKIGGLPVPSLAITKKDQAMNSFGEITLLGDAKLIDPKTKSNKVFAADIYSPRYPSINYRVDFKNMRSEMDSVLKDVNNEHTYFDANAIEDRGRKALEDSGAVALKFLKENGKRVPKPIKYEQKISSQEIKAYVSEAEKTFKEYLQYLDEETAKFYEKGTKDFDQLKNVYHNDGVTALKFLKATNKKVPRVKKDAGNISHYKTSQAYREAAMKFPEYQDFLDDLESKIIEKEQIFDGFTYSGNRKYLSHNVENVVRLMKRGLNDAEGFNYGVGSIRAVFTKKFKSIKDIKKSKNKLITEEEFSALKEEIDNEFVELANKMEDKVQTKSSPFGFLDAFSEHLKEAAEIGVPRVFDEYYKDFTQDDINEVAGFLKKLEDFPTEYFEAKLQRAVGLSEFSGAVVPKGKEYNKAIQILKDNGVTNIKRYTEGDAKSRAEAVGKFEKLFFQENEKKRGSFSLNPQGEKVIKLFDKADLSTFIHESGHFFLEAMGEINNAENATADLKEDYNKILNFLEVEDVSQIGTEQHEKFARAFEAYAFEGKAPSVELESVFRRFKQWLINIYKKIQNLDVELNDEIRGVFDRMLATEEQIKTSEEVNNYKPLLTKEKSGMSNEQYAEYVKAAEKATQEAENTLLKRTMTEIKREKLKGYREEKAKVREQVEQDVMQSPANQALYYLQKGELFDREMPEGMKGQKLDTKILTDTYGKEVLKLMPKSVPPIYKQGGTHPDTLAEIFGFDSGDAMVKALWNANPLNQQIDQQTEQIMKEKHGDILNDGTIEAEADKAIHNDNRANFIATELELLQKLSNQQASIKKPAIKKAAERYVSETQVKDIRLGKYIAAEVRAAKNAQIELTKGNLKEAAEQKRKQLFNHYLYIEARDAQNRVEKIVKYMNKFNKKSTRERLAKARGGYLDQIDKLLERSDFRKSVSIKAAEKRISLSKWIEGQRADGHDVVISEQLEDESKRKSYKIMTVEEVFGLDDTIKNIEHLARTKNKLLASKDAREFNEVVDDVVKTIEENNKLTETVPDFAPSFTKNIKKFKDKFLASHTRMEFLFEQLDGHKNLGTVWTNLFKPLADAELAEQQLMTKTTTKLNEAFKKRYTRLERAKWYVDKVHVEGVNKSFNKASLISLALNWGNEGNRQAIRDGYGWSDAQVREILDNLEKKDWDLVQELWDTIDELWPASQKLHKDVTGVAPPKVEASPINTKHGTFKGGYYPLKYDPEFSFRAFQRDQKQSTEELFGSNWIRPQTKQGHLQERVGSAGQKVKLDLSVMTEHITNTIHDISHRKAVLDVDRLTRNPRVRDIIERAAGKEMYKQIRPWLRSITNDRREAAGVLEGIMGRARVGATVVNMGWKVTTAIVQPLGYLQSVDILGEKYAWKGLKKFYGNPAKMKETTQFIMDRSTMMQNRQKTFDRDVRDTLKRTTLKGTAYEVQQSFFYFTGLMDMGVAVPTWMGAYEKAMDGQVEGVDAGNENKAIDFADKTVRMSQSAGGAKDLALIQTGSEYHRVFTMFYSYFNVLYNLFKRRTKLTKGVQDVPRFAASMMYLWVAPAILSELVAGRGPEEDEENAAWAAQTLGLYPLSTIVGVRDVSNAVLTKYDYNASPAFDALDHTSKAFNIPFKLATGEEVKRSDVKSALLATSYWGQLPGRQMWITGEYLYDYSTGEESDFNFRDLFFARKK